MAEIWQRFVAALRRLIRRFMDRTPQNPYERIAFNGIREAAATFGSTA